MVNLRGLLSFKLQFQNKNENLKFNLNIKNKFVSKIFPEIQTSDKTYIKADI